MKTEQNEIKVRIKDGLSIELRIPAEIGVKELKEFAQNIRKVEEIFEEGVPNLFEGMEFKETTKKKKRMGVWTDEEDEILKRVWDSSKTKNQNCEEISKHLNRTPKQIHNHVYYWKRHKKDEYKKLGK